MWLACVQDTNASSMGNKHEELEATVQQGSYNMVMEIWWNDSTSGVLQWMATSFLEEIGGAEEAVACFFALGIALIVLKSETMMTKLSASG